MSTIPARRCLLPRRTKRTNPRLKSVGKTQRHKGHKDTKKAAIKNYLRRPSLCLCALCVFVFYLPISTLDSFFSSGEEEGNGGPGLSTSLPGRLSRFRK